jgi:hypothetical protein
MATRSSGGTAAAALELGTAAAVLGYSRSGSILAPWLTHTGFNSIGYLGSRLEGLLSK